MEKPTLTDGAVSVAKIKKENLNDEIKDFAETAMNELLGWYGYDNSTREEQHQKVQGCSRSQSGSNSSGQESPKYSDGCKWCGKSVEENAGISSAVTTFCSELCFSHSRRANFKKNKTCDWCRHVRHTVSYVDFQDGASQLQFCSDKCLNQYKMHIFCRETRAHLELHPHLHGNDSTSGTLITPDMWLKNCKSPELIRSPSPTSAQSPKSIADQPQTSPLSLISVAHSSKLMAPQTVQPSPKIIQSKGSRFKAQKRNRTRCTSMNNIKSSCINNIMHKVSNDAPQDLRVRQSSPIMESNNNINNNNKSYTRYSAVDTEELSLPADTRRLNMNAQYLNYNLTQSFLRKSLDTIIPPPTVLVPYPVVLPIPVPIPIPIPIPANLIIRDGKIVKQLLVDESSQTDNTMLEPSHLNVVTEDDEEATENFIKNKSSEEKLSVQKQKRVIDKKN